MKGFDNNQLKELYKEFNERYFNNKLDNNVIVEWSNKMTRIAGNCRTRKFKDGTKEVRVALSIPYHKRFTNEIVDTLVHEMVHVRHPNDGHGAKFLSECKRINESFGLNLTQYATDRATPKVYKHKYKCSVCGNEFKRVQRIDVSKYTCNCIDRGHLIKVDL